MNDVKNLDYYRGLSYGITLRKDEEGDWVARVEELPGCTAHGGTQAEALEHLEDVKTAWIEDAIEAGDSIPEPAQEQTLPSGKWLQRVPRSLHKGLVEMAQIEGVSLNQFVTTVLAEAVGRRSVGRPMIFVRHSIDVEGWGAPRVDWLRKAYDVSSWQIDQQKPIRFVIDALASPIFAIPDQLNELQFKVTDLASKSKKELAYKS
jgi:antitoxin HicB